MYMEVGEGAHVSPQHPAQTNDKLYLECVDHSDFNKNITQLQHGKRTRRQIHHQRMADEVLISLFFL